MKKLSLTLLALSISGAVFADENDSYWSINPSLSYQLMDRDIEDHGLIGIGLERRFNQTWGAELKYLQGDMKSSLSSSNEVDVKHLMLEGLYYIDPSNERKLSPFLAAGIGESEYDYDIGGEEKETTVLLGTGFKYAFSNNWSSKVGMRWVHGLDDSTNDVLVNIGLSYAFGKTKAAPIKIAPKQAVVIGDIDKDGVNDNNDKCNNTPVGASVNSSGCELDSDNDGVVNSKDKCLTTTAGAKVDSSGCAEKLTTTETMSMNVNFSTGSDQLTNDSLTEIEKVATFMRKYNSVSGVIEGHTDSQGAASFNEALSQSRAESVVKTLVDQYGINSSRLSAKGYGESNPVASNETAEGRQQNRRVSAVFEAQVTK